MLGSRGFRMVTNKKSLSADMGKYLVALKSPICSSLVTRPYTTTINAFYQGQRFQSNFPISQGFVRKSPVSIIHSFNRGLASYNNGGSKRDKEVESVVSKSISRIKEEKSKPPSSSSSTAEDSSKKKSLKEKTIETLQHYWSGTKLLAYEIKISSKLLLKVLRGIPLIRREKRQLLRTVSDLFRLVPFAIFVIVPFLELLLPLVIRLFPNMLPSTFEDSLSKEEKKRKQLKVKLEMASFLRDTMNEMALDPGNKKGLAAKDFSDLFRKFRVTGEPVSTEELIKVCQQFGDSLTLENLSRPQLISMCRYMNLKAFGTDNYLRYLIRNQMKKLKDDDKMIKYEGVDTLTIPELQSACQARGIRFMGVSPARMKLELNQWLELHLVHKVPSSLLILSRAFSIEGKSDTEEALRATISSLPDEVVSEVEATHSAISGENNSLTYKQKLEVLEQQEEMIADELAQEEKERLNEKKQEDASMASADSNSESSPKEAVLTKEQKDQLKDAILVLTSRSAVGKEREQLNELKQDREEFKESMQELGENEAKESKASNRLGQKLEKMIKSLDKELETYNTEVGSKFNLIEINEKGQVSVENLEVALKMIRDHPNEEKIKEIVKRLDEDGDGQVFIQELIELAEVEGHGRVVKDSPAPDSK